MAHHSPAHTCQMNSHGQQPARCYAGPCALVAPKPFSRTVKAAAGHTMALVPCHAPCHMFCPGHAKSHVSTHPHTHLPHLVCDRAAIADSSPTHPSPYRWPVQLPIKPKLWVHTHGGLDTTNNSSAVWAMPHNRTSHAMCTHGRAAAARLLGLWVRPDSSTTLHVTFPQWRRQWCRRHPLPQNLAAGCQVAGPPGNTSWKLPNPTALGGTRAQAHPQAGSPPV
jgi:hypothetical protein